jgi:hypothetical protein
MWSYFFSLPVYVQIPVAVATIGVFLLYVRASRRRQARMTEMAERSGR